MATLDIQDLRDELSHFFRYSDVLSTSVRGVTRRTEGYTVGVGGEATHTFSSVPIRDFKYITINAVNKYFLRDYTVNWTTGVVTWNVALVQNDVVATQYDYGSSDKIYPDMPRDDLSLTSFPRVGIELTSISTQPLGLGGAVHISDILVTVIVWSPVNKDTNIAGGFGGLTDLEDTMTLIRAAVRTNAKGFYTFPWIYPKGTAPITRGQNDKVMQHSQDFLIRFRIE
jgi:hypothetical protein